MACNRPRRGYWARVPNPSGKRSIVFNAREGYIDKPVDIACGQCMACRLKRSAGWGVRLTHEASLYPDNCFITLTYADEHLPPGLSLHKPDIQNFNKRLRERFSDRRMKFYYCGEYGEQLARPHYHSCVFNFDFPDKERVEDSPSGEPQWDSELLSTIWGKGRVRIGTLTFESAQYVAKYITKKITGKLADQHYQGREPEFAHGSHGLGEGWFEKFKRDIYPDDFVVLLREGKGVKIPVPKYYDRLLEKLSPEEFEQIKARRQQQALNNRPITAEDIVEASRRREANEFIRLSKSKLYKRSIE